MCFCALLRVAASSERRSTSHGISRAAFTPPKVTVTERTVSADVAASLVALCGTDRVELVVGCLLHVRHRLINERRKDVLMLRLLDRRERTTNEQILERRADAAAEAVEVYTKLEV